eukprot:COSAG01_NODE_8219_length_2870_cov_2.578131_1_plen_45_part_10
MFHTSPACQAMEIELLYSKTGASSSQRLSMCGRGGGAGGPRARGG